MQGKDDQKELSSNGPTETMQDTVSQENTFTPTKDKRKRSSSYGLLWEQMGSKGDMSNPESIDFVDTGVHMPRYTDIVSFQKKRSSIRLSTHIAAQPQQEVQVATEDENDGYDRNTLPLSGL